MLITRTQPRTAGRSRWRLCVSWGPTRVRFGRATVAALATSALLVTMVPAPTASAASSLEPPSSLGQSAGTRIDDTLTEIGQFPRVPQGITIGGHPLVPLPVTDNAAAGAGLPVASPATGKIYQFYTVQKSGGTGVGVVVREGANPTHIAETFLLPDDVKEVEDFEHRAGSELAHTFDVAGKRIFFWLEGDGQQDRRQILIFDEAAPTDVQRTKLVPLAASVAVEDLLPGVDPKPYQDWSSDQGTEIIRWAFNDLVNWLGTTDLPPQPNLEPPPPPPAVQPPSVGSLGEPLFLAKPAGQFTFQGMTYINGKLYMLLGMGGQDLPAGALLLEMNAGPTLVPDSQGNPTPNPDLFQISLARPIRGCRSIGPSEFATDDRYNGFAPVLRTPDAFYVGCSASSTSIIVKLDAAQIGQFNGTETVFTGTGIPGGTMVDQAGKRIHSRVYTPLGNAILTFDATEDAYVGLQAVAAGFGAGVRWLSWGLDPTTGRLFTQTPQGDPLPNGTVSEEFGLGLTSGRFTPVQPPVTYPDLYSGERQNEDNVKILQYDSIHRHLLLPDHGGEPPTQNFIVLHDEPPPVQPPAADPDSATKDVEEEAGKTGVNFSGNASGYGSRELLVGGIDGLVPNRVIDAGGAAASSNHYDERPLCQRADREIILARVESAKLDNSLQSALARPVQADGETREDLRRPSRCTEKGNLGQEEDTVDGTLVAGKNAINTLRRTLNCSLCFAVIDQLLTTAGASGVTPPEFPGALDDVYPSQETRGQLDQFTKNNPDPFLDAACRPDSPANTVGADPAYPLAPALNGFSASVNCAEPTASLASASVVPVNTDQLPNTGNAAVDGAGNTVESLAPSVTIGSSSTAAKTYRHPTDGTVSEVVSIVKGIEIAVPGAGAITIGGIYAEARTVAKGRPGTAKSTYTRLLWGVRVVTPSGEVRCDLCADEGRIRQIAAAISAALGERGAATVPKMDAELAAGTPRGYQTGIQRDPFVIITNDIVQGDSMRDLPALEIALYNDSVHWGRQRQIFQFAGVKANSQYGITCLGGGKPDGNHCVLPPTPPSSLTVALTDDKFKPLAGGTFSIGAQSCTTAATGRCTMTDIAPGKYAVKQTAAPEGYLSTKDFFVDVRGSGKTVSVINLRNAASVVITLHDSESGAPLAGGAFQVVSDIDGNQVRGPKDPVVASCTTTANGDCPLAGAGGKAMSTFPLGDYLVQEVTAPQGYQPADPVGFELAKPGEIAELAFTNGLQPTAVLSLEGGRAEPVANIIPSGGGPTGGLVGSLAEGLRWFAKHLGQVLLLGSALALFGSPAWQSWRRRLLLSVSNRPF